MLIKMNKMLRRERAQGMTEYIIIVALIAIAAIGVVTLFGQNIRAMFAASTDALTGKESVKVDTKESSKDQVKKTLRDFSDHKYK
jgi:Flp pilus assembly pilin Flp